MSRTNRNVGRYTKNTYDNSNTAVRRQRQRQRKRTRLAKIFVAVAVCIVIITAALLSVTVFFNIKAINVYGDSVYSVSKIKEVGKINLEDNLIRLDSKKAKQLIETKLPYIQEVKIKKKLPTTVEITVTEAVVAGYVKNNDGYSLISTEGKLLENVADKPENFAEIIGISTQSVKISQIISDKNGGLKSISKIYKSFNTQKDDNNITAIDVTDNINMSFVYRDRITVELGSVAYLDEKLEFVSKVLLDTQKIPEDDVGVIYASNPKRISFRRQGSYEEMLLKEQEELTSSSISNSETEVSSELSDGVGTEVSSQS